MMCEMQPHGVFLVRVELDFWRYIEINIGLAFLSTGADAAIVLEQVAIIPIPAWWPFQGMQIPEDDNMGAPMVSCFIFWQSII